MRCSSVALIALALLGAGCVSSTGPSIRQVSGFVHHPTGSTPARARVSAGGENTFTDAVGHDALRIRVSADPVTLTASDNWGAEVIVGRTVGTVRVTVPPIGIRQDIVLDHFEPV